MGGGGWGVGVVVDFWFSFQTTEQGVTRKEIHTHVEVFAKNGGPLLESKRNPSICHGRICFSRLDLFLGWS